MQRTSNPGLFDLYVKAFEFGKKKGWLRPHPEYKNVYLVTYSKSFESWNKFKKYPLAILLRSTIYRIENGKVIEVLPSFTKFPNLHEENILKEKATPVVAFEKIDGSLVSISRSEGLEELLIRSKGGWSNFVVAKTKEILENNPPLKKRIENWLETRFDTVMFELDCGVPHSQYIGEEIVKLCQNVDVNEVKLWLLGAIRKDGTLVSPYEVGTWPYIPKMYNIKSWDECLTMVKNNPEQEGVVVWLNDFPVKYEGVKPHPLVKVKSRLYFLMKTLKNSLTTALLHYENIADDLNAKGDEKLEKLKILHEEFQKVAEKVVKQPELRKNLSWLENVKTPKEAYIRLVKSLTKGKKIEIEDMTSVLGKLRKLERRMEIGQ